MLCCASITDRPAAGCVQHSRPDSLVVPLLIQPGQRLLIHCLRLVRKVGHDDLALVQTAVGQTGGKGVERRTRVCMRASTLPLGAPRQREAPVADSPPTSHPRPPRSPGPLQVEAAGGHLLRGNRSWRGALLS